MIFCGNVAYEKKHYLRQQHSIFGEKKSRFFFLPTSKSIKIIQQGKNFLYSLFQWIWKSKLATWWYIILPGGNCSRTKFFFRENYCD